VNIRISFANCPYFKRLISEFQNIYKKIVINACFNLIMPIVDFVKNMLYEFNIFPYFDKHAARLVWATLYMIGKN